MFSLWKSKTHFTCKLSSNTTFIKEKCCKYLWIIYFLYALFSGQSQSLCFSTEQPNGSPSGCWCSRWLVSCIHTRNVQLKNQLRELLFGKTHAVEPYFTYLTEEADPIHDTFWVPCCPVHGRACGRGRQPYPIRCAHDTQSPAYSWWGGGIPDCCYLWKVFCEF